MKASQIFGLARSAVVYRARPWKVGRAARFYGQFVGPSDLCFDIGAHLGDRTAAFRRLGAMVVAVEPQPLFAAALRRLHGHDASVTLIESAVGARPGHGEMLISHATPTLSTLNAAWAARAPEQPGFGHVTWDARQAVAITTLDELIAEYGKPAFCKIDVEGFESEVLRGLSQPLAALSFEYLPAAPGESIACLDRLAELDDYAFNISIGETMRLIFDDWRDGKTMTAWIEALANDAASGDIYARLR
jgi:FkbM family methyltransferase